MEPKIIPPTFFQGDDVVGIARALIGKKLFTRINGQQTGGTIVETEAYRGAEDRACHAYGDRRTKRTEVMYREGGICYIYLCYGIHNLLNVVTNREGIPHAVLIRGIRPECGIGGRVQTHGPGLVTKALGIDRRLNGAALGSGEIWIEEGELSEPIYASPRIGVAYAKEDATLPWRFHL